jgi:hypothetical protein
LDARDVQLKWEDHSDSFISRTDDELRRNERAIMLMQERISDLRDDIDTWAYTIMGNTEAGSLYSDFLDIILSKLSLDEDKRYEIIPKELYKEIINNRCYDELIKFASNKNSRLVFQVLGVFIMGYGARMNEELREIILSNSRWEDEEFQFTNEKDKAERKKYLFEFREKVETYQEGEITNITIIRLTDLIDEKFKNHDDSLIDRPSIDYSIRRK